MSPFTSKAKQFVVQVIIPPHITAPPSSPLQPETLSKVGSREAVPNIGAIGKRGDYAMIPAESWISGSIFENTKQVGAIRRYISAKWIFHSTRRITLIRFDKRKNRSLHTRYIRLSASQLSVNVRIPRKLITPPRHSTHPSPPSSSCPPQKPVEKAPKANPKDPLRNAERNVELLAMALTSPPAPPPSREGIRS